MKLWMIKIAIVLVVLGGLFFWHKAEVKIAVDHAVTLQKEKYDKLIKELQVKSSETESKLNRQVLQLEVEKNAQIKDIDRKYRATIDSLRQRQERSTSSNTTGNSSNSESTERIDSEKLFGRHAEISLGIARDAEELKLHLNACYVQYDEIRDRLNRFNK